MDRITVLIADAQRLLAEALSVALAAEEDIDVVDRLPSTALDTARATAEHKPDVVLLDPRLPGMVPPSLVSTILAKSAGTRIVLLTMDDTHQWIDPSAAAGAWLAVDKIASPGQLAECIRWTAASLTPTGPPSPPHLEMTDVVLAVDPRTSEEKDTLARLASLSPREAEIFEHLLAGESAREIAEALDIAEGTVRNHVHSILATTGAGTKLGAAAIARQARFTGSPADARLRMSGDLFSPAGTAEAGTDPGDTDDVHRTHTRASRTTSRGGHRPRRTRTAVLVADHETLLAMSISAALAGAPDLEVIRPCCPPTKELLWPEWNAHRPDVVLVDLWMPGIDGAAGLHTLVEEVAPTKVIVLSGRHRSNLISATLDAGAVGYLPKSVGPPTIVAAIRRARAGEAPVFGDDLRRLSDEVDVVVSDRADARRRMSELSPRELRVLWLLEEGLLPKQIAQRLSLQDSTVRSHIRRVLAKLGVRNQLEALAVARIAGRWPPLGLVE